MEIKCKTNPYYFNYYLSPTIKESPSFSGVADCLRALERSSVSLEKGINTDKFVRRPVASKSATGLLGFVAKGYIGIKEWISAYKKNLKHTYEHKRIFALVEKELFGKNSVDSLTHDLDKLILHFLGFPKQTVTKLHRKISEHHFESGRTPNLRSMLCDNIASSPEFKPEKKYSVREFYAKSAELQKIKGFGEILEKYHYGENINFSELKTKKLFNFGTPVKYLKRAYQFVSSIII